MAGLGLVVLLVETVYVVGVAESRVTAGGLLAAISLLAISFTGILYAWRLEAGAPVD
jgi:hypothetical protein